MTRIHLVFVLGLVGCSSSTTTLGEGTMTTQLEAPRLSSGLDKQVAKWSAEGLPSTLNDGRRKNFEEIAQWLATRLKGGATADLIFVSTHNSRRSHISQLWAQAAALNQGLAIKTYSAGTETTAFNPRAVKALKTHGFQIDESNEVLDGGNIVYDVDFGEGHPTLKNFSKKISDPSNPTVDFGAVMVCSSADKSCPFVPGADLRVAVPYIDPKLSDGTEQETATYLAKSEEIGREMVWLMNRVTELLP